MTKIKSVFQFNLSKTIKILMLIFLIGSFPLITKGAQKKEFSRIEFPEIKGEYAPGQLLVKFKPRVKEGKIKEIYQTMNVSILKRIPSIDVRQVRIPADKNVPEMVKLFRKNPFVEYAEPNYQRYKTITEEPDDTYFPNQWALSQTTTTNHDIDAPEAWYIETGDPSIIIAIIDDGIDYNHEEFASPKLWINPETDKPGYDFGGTCERVHGNIVNTPDDDVMHESGSGHGTATAGIAAALTDNELGIAGTAWEPQIMPLKVEDSGIPPSVGKAILDSYIANAITFAVNNGAHVLSMSLGGPSPSSTLKDACEYAWENGKIIVVSSGNENADIGYPARYSTTIAVGATNEIDNRIYPYCPGNYWNTTQGSCYGPELDVVAPGINIYATDWSASEEGYDTGDYYSGFGGTSASCPFVAGEAALLISKDPDLPNQRVRSIIQSTAEDQVGESLKDTEGFDIYYGYGRINLYNALSTPTKPDLTISDITFSDDTPPPGETITISATIYNDGRDYSEVSAISIGSQPKGAMPATADSYQGSYVPGNANDGNYSTAWASQYRTGWVKIDLTQLKRIGKIYWHDAYFVSDNQPGDFTIKVSTDDVSYTTIDSVTGYTESSYIKILDNPVEARYVKMEMTARASGSAATLDELGVYEVYYDTVVRFYDGEPGEGGTQIGPDQHLPPVPASGTKTASLEWTPSAGTYDIWVVVDEANSIPESNEINNETYETITVQIVLSILISFDPWNIGNVDPNTVTTMGSTEFIVVQNDGNVDETFTMKVTNEGGIWSAATTEEGNTVEDFFVMSGLFTSIDYPTIVEDDFNEETHGDVIISTSPKLAGSDTFACASSTGNGVNVPRDEGRKLWLQFKSPKTTTTYDQQTIVITVGAQE